MSVVFAQESLLQSLQNMNVPWGDLCIPRSTAKPRTARCTSCEEEQRLLVLAKEMGLAASELQTLDELAPTAEAAEAVLRYLSLGSHGAAAAAAEPTSDCLKLRVALADLWDLDHTVY